jgi:hypothetical protein
MARMPGAVWRPLAANWASQPRMKAYDIFCLHTMVGSLDGTDGYFRASAANGPGYAGTESHFGVGPDGTIYQWQDTDFQAEANGGGNWHIISSENADMGAPFPRWGGSDVPAFTPQQVEANARIAAWCRQTHGIPLEQIPDAKPGRRGVGFHRLGVPGYMVAGAEQWSSSRGKVCPGDRRIAQIPQIITRARQIAGGTQEDDMALFTDQHAQALENIAAVLFEGGTGTPKPLTLYQRLFAKGTGTHDHSVAAVQEIREVSKKLDELLRRLPPATDDDAPAA